MKKNWRGIKTLGSMKPKNNDTPSLTTKDGKYINDPVSIANTFNKFLRLLLKLLTQKSSFQINHSESFCHQKSMILS